MLQETDLTNNTATPVAKGKAISKNGLMFSVGVVSCADMSCSFSNGKINWLKEAHMGSQINDLVAMGDVETLYELMADEDDWIDQLDAA